METIPSRLKMALMELYAFVFVYYVHIYENANKSPAFVQILTHTYTTRL